MSLISYRWTALMSFLDTPYCSACGLPQHATRSGLVCARGHGGADSVEAHEAVALRKAAGVSESGMQAIPGIHDEVDMVAVNAFLTEVRVHIREQLEKKAAPRATDAALKDLFNPLRSAMLTNQSGQIYQQAILASAGMACIGLNEKSRGR